MHGNSTVGGSKRYNSSPRSCSSRSTKLEHSWAQSGQFALPLPSSPSFKSCVSLCSSMLSVRASLFPFSLSCVVACCCDGWEADRWVFGIQILRQYVHKSRSICTTMGWYIWCSFILCYDKSGLSIVLVVPRLHTYFHPFLNIRY
jgi:hypothetical protein